MAKKKNLNKADEEYVLNYCTTQSLGDLSEATNVDSSAIQAFINANKARLKTPQFGRHTDKNGNVTSIVMTEAASQLVDSALDKYGSYKGNRDCVTKVFKD
jgi:hypothetical protein